MKWHKFESLKLKPFYIIYHLYYLYYFARQKISSTQNQQGNTHFPIKKKKLLYSNSDQVRIAGVAG